MARTPAQSVSRDGWGLRWSPLQERGDVRTLRLLLRRLRIGLILSGSAATALAFRISVTSGVLVGMIAIGVVLVTTFVLKLQVETLIALLQVADGVTEIAEQEATIALNTSDPGRLAGPACGRASQKEVS